MNQPLIIAACHDAFPIDCEALAKTVRATRIQTMALPWHWSDETMTVDVLASLKAAQAILLRSGTLPGQVLAQLPNLRIVACHGAGVDQVDVAAAHAHNIWVTNTPGANAAMVASYALGCLLALLRGFHRASQTMIQQRDWDGARIFGDDLAGKTVGLVGCGHTAQAFGKLCLAMGTRVLATRKNRRRSAPPGFEIVNMNELLTQAQVVSLHVPFNEHTANLFDARCLALMRPGSYLINTARGGIADLDAINHALRNGHLAGAALDVFPAEPADTRHPIFDAPNVILTPHMAASTPGALAATARMAGDDIARVLSGQPPQNAV